MVIHVAAAVIEDDRGRVLLSRRHDHVHQGGLWEFPGGKLEPGEGLPEALVREIDEELGLTVLEHRPLIRVHHDYGDKAVLLDVHRVVDWSGEAVGREGQQLAWVERQDLSRYEMPVADRPIVRAVLLPDRYLFTGGENCHDVDAFLGRLEKALAEGVRLVQLRPAGCDAARQAALVEGSRHACAAHGAQLLLSSRIMSLLSGSDGLGLHLTARDLMSLSERPEVSGLLAASCHNRDEVRQAERLGLDFVVLSPVLPTTSHPGATVLGWARFSRLAEEAAIPVFALGGVGRCSPREAWGYGAQGIAGIRGMW